MSADAPSTLLSPEAPQTTASSIAYAQYLRNVRLRRQLVYASQAGLLVLFFIGWEVFPRLHYINPMLTSYPSAIWTTFMGMIQSGQIWEHVWATLQTTVLGFIAAMLLGMLCAIVLWWSDFLHKVIEPYLVVANAMPKIAFVPIFYIWLGDVLSIYGMAIAISVFITIIILYTGFVAIDENKIKLAALFGASRLQILRKVVIPGSVPSIIAALKVNVGLTLVGVIVGEFQSAKAGLGYLIVYGSQIFQMNLVMTSVTLLGVISVVLYATIEWFERMILSKRR